MGEGLSNRAIARQLFVSGRRRASTRVPGQISG
ncbi:hypothetical protein ND748_07295 [Frankia sp. AiPs1]|nr:hypothetical protein [Frankia sp. AiPs1]